LSLSSEATRYVRGLRMESKAASVSAVFENIIRDLQRKTELEQLNARTIAYYDSLSPETLSDTAGWGELGMMGLAALEEAPVVETEKTVAAIR